MRSRLLFGFLAITLVLLAALEVPLAVAHARRQVGEVSLRVERDAVVLASLAEDAVDVGSSGRTPAASELFRSTARDYARRTGARVVLTDAAGTSLDDTDPPPDGGDGQGRAFASRTEVATALAGRVATGRRHSEDLGIDFVFAAVPVSSAGRVWGAVRITYPIDEVQRGIVRYRLALVWVAAVSLLAVALAGIAIAQWVTSPLRRLEAAATALGEGRLSTRARVLDGPPELRALAASFDRTADRLDALVDAQRAFAADASHQLRTPLTTLALRLDALAGTADATTSQEVAAAQAEVDRLGRIVEGLLALARVERQAAEPEPAAAPIDVQALLAARVAEWSALAAEHDVALALADGPERLAAVDPDRLAQALDVLLDNALDVAPTGSVVRLRADASPTGPVVHVVDEGPGMPADHRARAFDRFWRAPGADPATGSGLGLAIAARLLAIDGATARLDPGVAGGVDAVLSLRAGPG